MAAPSAYRPPSRSPLVMAIRDSLEAIQAGSFIITPTSKGPGGRWSTVASALASFADEDVPLEGLEVELSDDLDVGWADAVGVADASSPGCAPAYATSFSRALPTAILGGGPRENPDDEEPV